MHTALKSNSPQANAQQSKNNLTTRRLRSLVWVPLFDYHAVDQAVVRKKHRRDKNIFSLAADVGAPGVKVRPNGLPSEVPVEKTLAQIGLALRECGEFAADLGVQIRLEVQRRVHPNSDISARFIDVADHDNVYVCWNSNFGEVEDGFNSTEL